MDPRLLRLYSDELTHLRELGAEFAREFPKIAERLALDGGVPVPDPYVERLLEGFAFLAARVQLKLESEQPRLIAQLLEALYPNFLAPLPSMMVARLQVDPTDPNLVRGFGVPRGSALSSMHRRGQDTRCEFRTAQAVTLWPIELVEARYTRLAPELAAARLPAAQACRGALRLRLRTGAGLPWRALGLDRLTLYLSAPDDVAFRLHELLLGAALGSWVPPGEGSAVPPALQWRDAASLCPVGFGADEALLPETPRQFSGHRLLQEVAAMPQRLLFVELAELAPRLARVAGDEVEILLPFARGDDALEALVDAGSVALFCTPAINLFRKRLDRIQLGPGAWEYHVVPDRTRPMDFEVHHLESVLGFGTGELAQQRFLPLYASQHAVAGEAQGYYTVRREPRLLSPRQREQGTRSSYVGEELFISLVDPRHAPYRQDIRQLSVSAWVTNRDLPLLLPHEPEGWTLDAPGPVRGVTALQRPTRPVSRRPVGELGWSLVSLLSLNHLPLVDEPPERAAATLCRLLALFGPPEDGAWARQVAGLQSLQARNVVRRLPFKGPLTFGSGVELTLELDELAFQGSSAFVLGSVLERFLARHAALNTFTQLTLRSVQRGELMRWPPRVATRAAT
ncbi:type VI secretion system baseplate subunit TssF [Azohydromonas caseinilytica]|uniref:Type VI secretion system baseplate subunit TssF n=1 Tax=Azohydromonas caseinilytica TaxID=2728836 RepID=A0A848FCP1_9BURK|nr:type VI secretion system baseplate subunit TssF [Azohydromonas caseinilytica]NML16545.1 type VI secretion system baseplate subunit TssF [Azohydromonas caseinilytica]